MLVTKLPRDYLRQIRGKRQLRFLLLTGRSILRTSVVISKCLSIHALQRIVSCSINKWNIIIHRSSSSCMEGSRMFSLLRMQSKLNCVMDRLKEFPMMFLYLQLVAHTGHLGERKNTYLQLMRKDCRSVKHSGSKY